jgi:hypothetical protein
MDGRFTTMVSLYGQKSRSLAHLLRSIQEILHLELGDKFLPYTIEQIHGTLVGLDAVIDQSSGLLVHKHHHDVTRTTVPMDSRQVLHVIRDFLSQPCRIRFGGYQPGSNATFLSRGIHPYERTFSAQGRAFALIGWPMLTILHGPANRPLDDLRRAMNKAGVMHSYHKSMTDIDNDFYLVIGHHDDAPADQVSGAVHKVRTYLEEHPIEIDLGISQVSVIVSDSSTLVPAKFIGKIPADEPEIRRLFEIGHSANKNSSSRLF